MNISTLLTADIVIPASKLRELLDGLTTDEFIEFVERHATVLVPGTPFTETELLAAIKTAGITDPVEIKRIASEYLSDAAAIERSFKTDITEYVVRREKIKEKIAATINLLTRKRCEEILTNASIHTRADETIEELRAAIQTNYDNETLSADNIQVKS